MKSRRWGLPPQRADGQRNDSNDCPRAVGCPPPPQSHQASQWSLPLRRLQGMDQWTPYRRRRGHPPQRRRHLCPRGRGQKGQRCESTRRPRRPADRQHEQLRGRAMGRRAHRRLGRRAQKLRQTDCRCGNHPRQRRRRRPAGSRQRPLLQPQTRHGGPPQRARAMGAPPKSAHCRRHQRHWQPARLLRAGRPMRHCTPLPAPATLG